mgnify:FL=1
MKPIVFYDFDNAYQDKITIKKDKFEKLLKDVYNAGFEDGRRDSHLYLSNPPRNDEWEITCGSNVKRDPISGSLHMKETGVSDKI